MDPNIRKLQNDFHVSLRRFFKTPIGGANQCGPIIDSYRRLASESGRQEGESKLISPKKFDINDFKKSDWQYSVIDYMGREMKKNLSGFVESFIVHGSFATNDFLPKWSDLDALVILNDKTFESEKNLKFAHRELRKISILCYKIDPLAHHEFEFLTQFDLNHYPQYFFPEVLYNYASAVFGKNNFETRLRPDREERIGRLRDFSEKFLNKTKSGTIPKNNYFWKNDLSQMMLWPSLLLEAKDIFVYKKESFDRVKEEFPEFDFSPINRAMEARRKWKTFNLARFYPNCFFKLLPYFMNEKAVYALRKISRSIRPSEPKELIEEVIKKFSLLAQTGLQEILKNQNGIL